MKIDAMIKREDFFRILSDTITEYFSSVKGQHIRFEYKKVKGLQALVINQKFSFICCVPVPAGLKKSLFEEYNIRGSRLKYILGKILVALVSICPHMGMAGKAYITPGLPGKNVYISPQNRSIRFFDYDSMTVDCIIKKGFSDKYFNNQIEFRKNYHYDFLLPMTVHGNNWFREPILSGHPLARVTNEKMYQKGISDALEGIVQLAADTLTFVSLKEYAASLIDSIRRKCQAAEQSKHIRSGDRVMEITDYVENRLSALQMDIPVVMGHGDFQSGNIWVDENGKTWIYDWETAGRRSIWYDCATLNYSLRRAYGWNDFFADNTCEKMLTADPRKDYTPEERAAMRYLVLLEDFLFYLDDMLELPEDWGGNIFDGFMDRIISLYDEGKI